jgi:hypothetical protein
MSFPSDQTNFEHTFAEKVTFLESIEISGNDGITFLGGPKIFSDQNNNTINFTGVGTFINDLYIGRNFSVSGISTFYDLVDVDRLLVRTRFDIGVGGTVLNIDGTTKEIGLFNVDPQQKFHFNSDTNSIVLTDTGIVGIGTVIPESGIIDLNNITQGQLKLNVNGSVSISRNIYDSAGSPGASGAFLNRDANGIRWTAFTPGFSQGIFVQDEGVYIPIVGAAQSFTVFNFAQINSLGTGTDTIVPIPDPTNPTLIAKIQSKDFWGFTGNNIYRMSNVGIQNNNPTSTLDITGTVHATGAVDFDSTLNVDLGTTLNSTLDVDGATTLNSTLDVDGATTLNSTLDVDGATTLNSTLDVDGATTLNSTLDVDGATTLNSTLDVDLGTTLNSTLDVDGATTLNSTLDVDGATTLNSTLDVDGATTLNSTLDVDGATTLSNTLGVTGATTLTGLLNANGGITAANGVNITGATSINGTLAVTGLTTLSSALQVGIGGTVITTTGSGNIGIGTNVPSITGLDIAKDVLLQKALYDSNRNVGYKTEFYKTPRTVLGQVAVNASGEVIGDRFFDAANLIRLNLDFIATEAVGFITSTDYKNPVFNLPDISSCRDDIKDILKAITIDITKGGNSKSVGAGLSYYNGSSLIHITGNDSNGYSIKEATVVAITTAAQISQRVINNTALTKSYQSGVSSIRQIKDLTIQDDASVGSNSNFTGCANVVSAIFVTAGIVSTIIDSGPGAAPPVTQPNGKTVWIPPGADVRNLVFVNKYGNDDNGGRTEGDAKLTIAAAAAVAESGDTIMVRSGVYYENNPVGLRTNVSVSGQDLRLVTVVPQNSGQDVFHVRRGCLVENLNFACDTGQSNPGGAAVAFPPTDPAKFAASGFIAPGPATEGPSGRWKSPYVRNCTNFMPLSIGMKIDGDHATASTIGADLKSMVCDSFTQYNEAGIGVSLTNNGYAQLVSIFTINCDIAIFAGSGGQCDLTNSNSSFGNFGLVAVGLGSTEFTGKVNTTTTSETDTIIFKEVEDGSGNVRRPYDGQALWFKIDLVNYNTGQVGIITAPLQQLKSITVVNGGSGFSQAAPPDITIFDTTTLDSLPLGPEGIIAELSPNISDSGAITSVDIVNSGRNYLPNQPIGVRINGAATNDLVAVMEPIYFTVSESTTPTPVTGITTVTLNEFVPYIVFKNDVVEMSRISRILTSGHSFEYIGTGTDINISTPLKGAVPIDANKVVSRDGGQVPFTSTDQKGNFNIGQGISINQQTSTITGRAFSKAIQAEVTPLILALR